MATTIGALTIQAVVLSATAAAQRYPIVEGRLSVSATTVSPGSSLTVSGRGFAPNALVVVTIQSRPAELGRGNADAAGNFTATVRVPAEFPPSTHTLSATGLAAAGGTLVLTAEVAVARELPVTGFGFGLPWWLPLGSAAALIGTGVIALRLVRR